MCAAVTVLLRTAMQVLSDITGVTVHGDIGLRGKLAFRVEVKDGLTEKNYGRLIGAADFLHKGISTLSREYPQHVLFELRDNE